MTLFSLYPWHFLPPSKAWYPLLSPWSIVFFFSSASSRRLTKVFRWSLFYSQWWQLFCLAAQVGGSVDVIVTLISTKKCHTHQLILTVQLTRQTTFWPLTYPVVSCHVLNENIRHQRKSKLHHLGNDLFTVSTFLYSNIVQRQSHAYLEV